MPDVVLFQPAKGLRADANLAAFIRYAREDLAVFGADLYWDSPKWELRGVARVSGRQKTLRVAWGHPLKKSPRSVEDYAPLDARNVDFFKAYLRYRYGLAPQMNPLHMLSAMRHLDQALSRSGKSIADAGSDDFTVATAACRSAYSRETAYRVGVQLQAIARFLDDHELVAYPLAWTCHIRRPTHLHHLGVERNRRRDRKLPSQRAIAALGEAYRRARDPMDVIAASAYALLLATHSRISELHRLDAYYCQVETVDNGEARYGLRWYPSKGGEPETRWVPTALVPLAREALRRIREATEPGRELARKYIAGEPILPQDDSHDPFARDGYISMETLGTVTHPKRALAALHRNGFDVRAEYAGDLGVPLSTTARLYLRAPIEEGFRAELPKEFPMADAKSRLRYDRALLVRTDDMTPRSSRIFWRLSRISSAAIEDTMNGKDNRTGRLPGLFERLALVDDDGETVRITPHQLRHYMTTLANEGNLSQLDIAKWAGRKDARHNRYYDHETAASLVSKARAVDEDMFDRAITVTPRGPVTAKQLMEGHLPAVHLTKYGACLHDFAMSPCPFYRDCLNCVEHACVKGDERAERALRARLAVMEKAVASAEDAAAAGDPSPEIWLSRKTLELARLRELVALIDNDTIPPGAILRLNEEARYAIDRDGPDAPERIALPNHRPDTVPRIGAP